MQGNWKTLLKNHVHQTEDRGTIAASHQNGWYLGRCWHRPGGCLCKDLSWKFFSKFVYARPVKPKVLILHTCFVCSSHGVFYLLIPTSNVPVEFQLKCMLWCILYNSVNLLTETSEFFWFVFAELFSAVHQLLSLLCILMNYIMMNAMSTIISILWFIFIDNDRASLPVMFMQSLSKCSTRTGRHDTS